MVSAARTRVAGILRGVHEKLLVEERVVAAPVRRRLYVVSATLAVFGFVAFGVLLLNVVLKVGAYDLDGSAGEWFADARTDVLTVVMIALAIFFGPVVLPIVILVVTVAWGIIARHAWRPFLLAAGMLTGVVLHQLVGQSIDRGRPPLSGMLMEADYTASFPSGHVLGASDFVLILTYLVFSRVRKPRVAVTAFVGAALLIVAAASSRLYLGYHWLTDALASVSLSLAILGAVIALDTYRTVRVRARLANPAPSEPGDGELRT